MSNLIKFKWSEYYIWKSEIVRLDKNYKTQLCISF